MGAITFLFLAALALRLIYLFQVQTNPAFYTLMLDCRSYDQWAMQIASGSWSFGRIFYQDPLYPYFLAVFYKVFGHDLVLVRTFQCVIGSINCVLIYLITREVYGKKAAWISGILSIFYGVFLYYDGMINKPFLGLFLIDSAILAFIYGVRKEGGGLCFLTGCFLGLAVMVRANILLLMPLFLCWIVLYSKGAKRLTLSISLLAGVALALSPSAIHNYMASGHFVLTTSQAGANFYIGNQSGNNTGTYVPPPFVRATPEFEETDFRAKAEFEMGKKLTAPEVSSYWMKETLNVIQAEPMRFLKNLWLKTRLFLNEHEVPDNHSYLFFKTYYSNLLKWNPLDFGIIGPLGLAGLLFALFRRGDTPFAKFLPLFFLFYLGSIVPFYIFSRYRLPAVPVAIMLSSFFLVTLAEYVKCGAHKKTTLAILTLVLAWLFVNSNIPKEDFSPRFANIANNYFQEQKFEKALTYYNKALKLAPKTAELYFFIGTVYNAMGLFKKAEGNLKKSIEINPNYSASYSGLAIVSMQLKKMDQAEAYFKMALKLRPYAPDYHNNLGMFYTLNGKFKEAGTAFKKALSLDPNFEPARQNLRRFPLK